MMSNNFNSGPFLNHSEVRFRFELLSNQDSINQMFAGYATKQSNLVIIIQRASAIFWSDYTKLYRRRIFRLTFRKSETINITSFEVGLDFASSLFNEE